MKSLLRVSLLLLLSLTIKNSHLYIQSDTFEIDSDKSINILVDSPIKDSKCQYPFDQFLNHHDQIKYTQCIIRIKNMERHDAISYSEAKRYYNQHYGETPKYFKEWYAFAQSKQCRIDRYDMLYQQIKPFKHSKMNYTDALLKLIPFFNSTQLTRFDVKDGIVNITVNSKRADAYYPIFKKIQNYLPDLTFVINTHAQPVVLSHPEYSHKMNKFTQSNHVGKVKLAQIENGVENEHEVALKSIHKQACAPNQYHDQLFQGYGLFINHPEEYQTLQKLPILSWGNYEHCTVDIIVPSVYHYDYAKLNQMKTDYPKWNQKTNQLIWRGTTSGSPFYFTNEPFLMPDHVCDDECTPNQYKIKASANYHQYLWFYSHRQRIVTHLMNYPKLADIKFNNVVEMNAEYQKMAKMYYKLVRPMPFANFFNYKMILDIDGNGYSGRILRLLRGNSLVFAAHYAQDWFSDILIPFYHYIPIDLSYSEINVDAMDSEFQALLSKQQSEWSQFTFNKKDDFNHPLGANDLPAKILYYQMNDDQAEQIALNGQQFAETYLRDEDMDCYLFRVIIELHDILNK
eukprot:NODE_790_length_3859_cov_0.497340.p1 type:complete len:570 gc:universal NODE_790_length_3859_cov_0.497340:3032-1323(-)